MEIQKLFYFNIISFIVLGNYTQQAEYINFATYLWLLQLSYLEIWNLKRVFKKLNLCMAFFERQNFEFRAGIVSLFQLPMLYLHCICIVLVKCLRCICIVFILYLHCFTFQCWRPWPSLTPLQLPGVVAPFNNKKWKIIQIQIQILIQIQI